MMQHYIGLIHKDPDSDFGVSFPDFPGCISAGSTLDEAAAMAAEALAGHIGLMADEGLPIPEPTSLDLLMQDPENRSGVPVLVPAPPPKASRVQRVNITIPEDVLVAIDRYAEEHGFNRSGFLVRAAKKMMETA
jgi:predicted RNase H-like HicB family nuclease